MLPIIFLFYFLTSCALFWFYFLFLFPPIVIVIVSTCALFVFLFLLFVFLDFIFLQTITKAHFLSFICLTWHKRVISSNKRLIYRQAWQVFSLLRSVWNQANIKEDRWVNHLCSPSRDHFKLEKLRIFIWKKHRMPETQCILILYWTVTLCLFVLSLHTEDICTVKIDGECSTNRIREIMSDAQVCLISPAKINASQNVCTLVFYCICWLQLLKLNVPSRRPKRDWFSSVVCFINNWHYKMFDE